MSPAASAASSARRFKLRSSALSSAMNCVLSRRPSSKISITKVVVTPKKNKGGRVGRPAFAYCAAELLDIRSLDTGAPDDGWSSTVLKSGALVSSSLVVCRTKRSVLSAATVHLSAA